MSVIAGLASSLLGGVLGGDGKNKSTEQSSGIINGIGQGITGIASTVQQNKMMEEAETMINDMPKYEDSAAFANAGSQAGRADRWAQEGLTSEQKMAAGQGADRASSQSMANASSMDAGLQGAAANQQTLSDSYGKIAQADAQQQQQNRGMAMDANKNFENAQTQAFNVEMGKDQNLMNLHMGDMASKKGTANNLMTNMNNNYQSELNRDSWSRNLPQDNPMTPVAGVTEDNMAMSSNPAPGPLANPNPGFGAMPNQLPMRGTPAFNKPGWLPK
jgi:hypothetical protein